MSDIKAQLRIYDKNVNLIAEIDNYEELTFERSFFKAGSFTVKLNGSTKYALELQKNRLIRIAAIVIVV